jgi:hypothetical protein
MAEIKWFHRSSWISVIEGTDGKRTQRHSRTYCRPMPKLYKGKKVVRAVKRAKVRAMKLTGHFKGDNRPVVFKPTFS